MKIRMTISVDLPVNLADYGVETLEEAVAQCREQLDSGYLDTALLLDSAENTVTFEGIQ